MRELRAGDLAARFEETASMVCASLTRDGEELLGLRDGLEAYVERGKTMGIPLLHPWANRLSDYAYGEVEIDREAPGVHDDGDGHPIHGLLHGRAAFDVIAHDEASLRARLDFGAHPEWLRSFPYPHTLEVAVHLRPDGLTHRTTLTNTGVIPVPVSFGWHPYFVTPEPLPEVDEPSDRREYSVGRVTIELLDGYETAHLFVPPGGDIVAFEPMTAPVDALRTGIGLRHIAPGASFTAAFRVRSLTVITDDLDVLDAPAAQISAAFNPLMHSPAKPILRGDWLGHAVHPLLTDITIGTFTSALLLDLLGGDEDAAALLLTIGVASFPAVAITGWSDWHEEEAKSAAIRRSGIVHAVLNVAGIGLQIASLAARRDGARGRGTALTVAGMGLTGAAGWIGGHLTYVKGSRVETEPGAGAAGPDL